MNEKKANPHKIGQNFANKHGIETSFLNNKSGAYANAICLTLFEKLKKTTNLTYSYPPAIFIYKKLSLIDKNSPENFCIPDTKNILQNEYPFAGRSIFFCNTPSLEEINYYVEKNYINKKISSSHFLAPFIHEWIHSLQLDYIYKTYGYGGDCKYLQDCYPLRKEKITGVELLKELENKTLSKKENQVVFDILGSYATQSINQYLEIFSETLTKIICDSISGTNFKQNPIEELKKTPKEFQIIFNKICKFI